MPTPHRVVAETLRMAGIGPDSAVYDLGCGDGLVPIAAASEKEVFEGDAHMPFTLYRDRSV